MLIFGEGEDRWSFPDPGHPIVDRANRSARGYDGHPLDTAIVLADVVSALAYLTHDCPSTKIACQKLAAIRRAVREMPLPEAE